MKIKVIFPLLFAAGIAMASLSAKTENIADEKTVLICNSKNAYAYHSHKCNGLKRCKASVLSIRYLDAKKAGRTPCKICYK